MKTDIIVQVQGMHYSSEQHAAHTSGHHVADSGQWPNQSVPGSMARLGLMVPISCGFEVVLGSPFVECIAIQWATCSLLFGAGNT